MSDLSKREEAMDAVSKLLVDGQTAKVDGKFVPLHFALMNALSALPSPEAVKVAYICDGRKCDNDCSECFRTLDIEHARDFKLMGDKYYQQESAEAVQGEWLYVENEPYSECSKCGRYIYDLDEDKYAYCPYCGARMIGGDSE